MYPNKITDFTFGLIHTELKMTLYNGNSGINISGL